MRDTDVIDKLASIESIAAHAGLAELGGQAFAFASVLLDDDENLTPLGNPNGKTRAELRARIEELLSGSALDAVELDE